MHTFVRLAPATDYSKAETWGVKRDACHWAHLEGLLPKGRVVQEIGRAVHRPAEPEPKRPGRDVIKEANCGRTARSVWSARSLLPLWRGPRRSKAPASRTHSIRFAKHVAAPSISIPHLQILHRKICAKITDFRIYVSSAPTNTPVSEQNCMFEPHRGALETARPRIWATCPHLGSYSSRTRKY